MVGVNFSATDMATLASRCIDQAEAKINQFLSRRYDISANSFQTSTATPPMVKAMAEQLSEGYLWQQLARGGAGKESMIRAKELIKSVMDDLKDITSYRSDLLNTTGSALADRSDAAYRILANTSDYTTTFDEDDELDWAVDSDKLSDIASARD